MSKQATRGENIARTWEANELQPEACVVERREKWHISKRIRTVRREVKHAGLSKAEPYWLVAYDPAPLRRHRKGVIDALRRTLKALPGFLRRCRAADIALRGWDMEPGILSSEIEWIVESALPDPRRLTEVEVVVRLSTSRHNPTTALVRWHHWVRGVETPIMRVQLLSFFENLHLEGRDPHLILRLFRQRIRLAISVAKRNAARGETS